GTGVGDAPLHVVVAGADAELEALEGRVEADHVGHGLIDADAVRPARAGATAIHEIARLEHLPREQRPDASLMGAAVVVAALGDVTVDSAKDQQALPVTGEGGVDAPKSEVRLARARFGPPVLLDRAVRVVEEHEPLRRGRRSIFGAQGVHQGQGDQGAASGVEASAAEEAPPGEGEGACSAKGVGHGPASSSSIQGARWRNASLRTSAMRISSRRPPARSRDWAMPSVVQASSAESMRPRAKRYQ